LVERHADVTLPLAYDQQGRIYDPIFYASTRPQTAEPQTIFNGRGLALVAVPWPWAMTLKLVRYEKKDPDHPPRLCAARHPLDSRRPREVDSGSLLAHGI